MKDFRWKAWIKEVIEKLKSTIYLKYEPVFLLNSPAFQKMSKGGFRIINIHIEENNVYVIMRKVYCKWPWVSWGEYFKEEE